MSNVILAAASSANGGQAALGFILITGALIGYWVPSIVAAWRRVPNTGSVVVINLFLGWTVIGWVVALAMACRSHRPRAPMPPGPLPPEPPQERECIYQP